jgi:hypothetical protein
MYFFNRYQASLKNDNPELARSQTFYINKGSGITSKEAYNLLSGRSVNKDLINAEEKPYNAWLKLDFTEKDKNNNFKTNYYHAGYGYDLENAVRKYPVKELGNDEERSKLLKSLQKGNLQQVTFVREGKEDKMFIEANPQYKNLNLYDSSLQKVFQGVDKKEKKDPEQSSDKSS